MNDGRQRIGTGLRRTALAIASLAAASAAIVAVLLFLRSGEVPRSARAGFTHDPPYMYADPDGRPRGLSVDVVSEAARRASLALDWVYVEAAQADEALRSGRVDVWPGLTVVPHREREFFFSDHWLQTVVWVVVRDKGALPGPDFAGDVGVAPLPITRYVMQRHFPRARLVLRPDGDALARDLCAGRLSVALVAAGELARVSTDPTAGCATAGLRAHVVPESTLRIAVAARRGHEAVATRIRAQIDVMAADGSIATMVLPYSYHAASEILAVYQLLQARSRARWLAIGAIVLAVFLLATLALVAALYRANRTVRRTYEQHAALEDKLHAAQRLELVGQLAGGVAHDFNNLVTIIVGYSDLARDSARGIPAISDALDEIRRAGERATELVQQLLTISGRQAVEPRVLALRDALTEMQPMLRRVLRDDVTMRLHLDAAPDCVRIDPGQLSRVLLNLTLNAVHAMPGGGHITIGTATDPARPSEGAGTVRIWFEDSGVGMRPEVAARAFEPFFTTKGPGRGTGLGLASVHGIVTQAGGEVHLRSVEGKGTRFDIRLPLVDGPIEPRDRIMARADAIGRRTLLVVEGSDDVRDLVVRILESEGHEVIPARDGLAALDVLQARRGEVALVLTDVATSGPSVRALYEQAQAHALPTRFLFLSEYADDPVPGADGQASLLPKPFTPAQLVAAVSAALSPDAPFTRPDAGRLPLAARLPSADSSPSVPAMDLGDDAPHPRGVGFTGLACGEVRGGNQMVHAAIDLPGLEGTLYSSACDGRHGGDIHYLSVCGSGLLTRLCLADVAGHGDAVAAVGREMYSQLRRSVDIIDERRVLRAIDRRVSATELAAMTTAVLVTYYPPSKRLTVSYAGHPPAWYYTARTGTWAAIEPEPPPASSRGPMGLPLGTGLSPGFTRRRIAAAEGDRLLLLTDGVLEATSPEGIELGQAGLARLLREYDGSHSGLVDHLRAGLTAHTGTSSLTHDDVSVFVAEVVGGPPGPALWHVLRNRVGFWAPRPVGDIRPVPTGPSSRES